MNCLRLIEVEKHTRQCPRAIGLVFLNIIGALVSYCYKTNLLILYSVHFIEFLQKEFSVYCPKNFLNSLTGEFFLSSVNFIVIDFKVIFLNSAIELIFHPILHYLNMFSWPI